MFSRLYVLIQENLTNFNIEGIYYENEINNRKNTLNNLHPFNKYFIRGPFSINNNMQNNTIMNSNSFNTQKNNSFMNANNTFNTQKNNSFMNSNNTLNTHNNQFLKSHNSFNSHNNQFLNSYNSNFKINDKNMDID